MSNRRNFLSQTGLATSAILLSKPANAFANLHHKFYTFANPASTLLLLHTNQVNFQQDMQLPGLVHSFQQKNRYAFLLNAGEWETDPASNLQFRLEKIGGLSVGIINITGNANGSNTPGNISAFAKRLKTDNRCNLVACLSGLGYKNTNQPGDLALAQETKHVDLIAGTHATNQCRYPSIILNRDGQEVILHYATTENKSIASVAIAFGPFGEKNRIDFNPHRG